MELSVYPAQEVRQERLVLLDLQVVHLVLLEPLEPQGLMEDLKGLPDQ